MGPFLGKQQLLLNPQEKEPEYFFNKMFSPSMFDSIAESMNKYAVQKLVGRLFIIFYPEQVTDK